MKAVILAGGLATRISEQTVARPKPMIEIEIGGKPVLWHILGYKRYIVEEYMANYFFHDGYRLRAGQPAPQE